MQLFLSDPTYYSIFLDDKRLNKQITECGQILSTALWIENCDIAESLYSKRKIYLPTHENHPIIRKAKYNYTKICDFMYFCTYEYKYRFDKTHKGYQIFLNLILFAYLFNKYKSIPFGNHTTNHKHINNLYDAYKKELILKWNTDKKAPKWTKREIPYFYKKEKLYVK